MKVIEQYIIASKLICRPEGASIMELADNLNISERAVFSVLNNIDDVLHVDTIREESNRRFVRYIATSDEVNLKLPRMELSEMEKCYYWSIRDFEENEILGNTPAKLFTKLGILLAERGCYVGDGDIKTNPIIKHRIPKEEIKKNISETLVPSIVSSIREKKWIDITYVNDENKMIETIFPIVIIVSSDGQSYLHGINSTEDYFCIKLSSIVGVKTNKQESIPLIPDINEILFDPFGPHFDSEKVSVKLSLSGKSALDEPKKTWPKQVSFIPEADGTVIMQTTTRSLECCKRWILERTPEVKVIEPKSLKDEIIDVYRQAMA